MSVSGDRGQWILLLARGCICKAISIVDRGAQVVFTHPCSDACIVKTRAVACGPVVGVLISSHGKTFPIKT